MIATLAVMSFNVNSLLGLVVLILDIVALVSLLTGRASLGHKLLWTILIVLLPVVGMILYYLIGRSSADANLAH